MRKLQEKLNFLLDKYSVENRVVLKNENTVEAYGREVPIFPHRAERRFIEFKNIVGGGTLQGISVMRVARIVEMGRDIYAELYRELDLCQYILDRKIRSIMVMENGNTLNAIATTADGVVCTIEISATLNPCEPAKDKHEIISQRGIACDVVVDAQLKQDSIYVFGADNQKYTDVDFELYGLSIEEIAVVRAAFAVAQKQNFEEMHDIDNNLQAILNAARVSAKIGERQVI